MLLATVKILSIFFKHQHFFHSIKIMLLSFNFKKRYAKNGIAHLSFTFKSLMSSFSEDPHNQILSCGNGYQITSKKLWASFYSFSVVTLFVSI